MNIEVDSEQGSLAKILTIFFFRPQGFVNVLDACHKCGSGLIFLPAWICSSLKQFWVINTLFSTMQYLSKKEIIIAPHTCHCVQST